MTFLQITQLINNKIRNAILPITKIEHADVEQAIVNELYQSSKQDNDLINEIFEPDENIEYGFVYKKIGKTVFYSGFAFKSADGDGFRLFFKNTIYKPKNFLTLAYGSANKFYGNKNFILSVSGGNPNSQINPNGDFNFYNEVYLFNEIVYFSGQYTTQD